MICNFLIELPTYYYCLDWCTVLQKQLKACLIALCFVLPTVSLPGSYTGGVLCHSEALHITLQPDRHGYGLSVVSPDSSLPAVIISSIDPGGPADRYDKETLYWPKFMFSSKFTL